MTDRRGFSLLEMLVAVTVGSVLMGIGVAILTLLLRLDRTGREHAHRAVVLGRLAEQFRDDVHAALRPMPAGTDHRAPWRLDLGPDRTVSYRITPESVERDETAPGKPVRHESYPLPEGCAARVSLSADRTAQVASLIVAPAGTPSPTSHQLRVDAVLGRDRRFVKSKTGEQ